MSTEKSSVFLPPENMILTDLGPCLHEGGVSYRVWALGHHDITVHIERIAGEKHILKLTQAKESGYFFGLDAKGVAGDLYKLSLDGGEPIPDLVSHYQPRGVFGPSMIVDAQKFSWQAEDWRRPAWNGQVVYECHVGIFTPEGTFRSAIEKLDYLVSLGITALEIMPVADWAGERNWGYDGVMLFAPAHAYGTPDDFRALIDACHLRGLAVILDVVYNHLGPEGNFSHQYSHYFFHEGKDNPWGQNFNLDGPNCEPVRAFLRQNIRYWLTEFRIDGFRMDATHMVHDPSPIHLLAEVAAIVHQHDGFIIAEDDRNSRSILEPQEKKGWNFDGVWSDDFHHAMRVSQTGEQQYFLSMFKGDANEIAEILRKGWLYSGQFSAFHHQPRGTKADDFPPQAFVFCISNHDQVGNRFQGERFHERICPAGYRALSLFLCLVPYTPMLFMGQEWGASAPFHYFTDMSEELGKKIHEGRKREFLETKLVTDPALLEQMLSPQSEKAFLESKLDWSEIENEKHGRILHLYRAGLKLRRELFGGVNPPRKQWQVKADKGGVTVEYNFPARVVSVRLQLNPEKHKREPASQMLLRSNAPEFCESGEKDGPETLIFAPSLSKS
jgi:maltooligosyltrehalose trehalohydrolase